MNDVTIPFGLGWGALHLGLLPLLFIVFGLAAHRAHAAISVLFLGLLAYWTYSDIMLLGFDWWACGTIVFLFLVSIPIGLVLRLLGFM